MRRICRRICDVISLSRMRDSINDRIKKSEKMNECIKDEIRNAKGMIMHDTALLAWVKSEKVFLKIQPGTGDNLLREDIRAGYIDYYLWSTFQPECIDIDGELNMECLDSGIFFFTESPDSKAALQSCYKEAFGKEYDESDVVVLLEE